MQGAEPGYLLIADITGYTEFMTESELDHARGILEELFAALFDALQSPFVLSNVQGDAILTHARSDKVADGQNVISTVEALYFGFAHELEHMINNTTCQCAACRNMSRLDLKLFVHFGDYAEQSIAGRTELGGPEVIVVHRLMKNTIREATGVRAYAAFTEAAVAAISVPEFFADRPHHTELIEQLGDCELTIIDMQPLWQDRRGRETVVVPEDDIWVEDVVGEIAVPPDRAWHLITDPQRRSEWMHGIEAMTRTNTDRGRMAAGAIEHCAHGGGRVSVFTIVDVRPYDHFTFDVAVPFSGSLRQTFFLTATEKGTRITVRTGTPRTDNALTRPLLKVFAAGMAKTVWSTWVKSLETLAEIAQNEPPGAPGTHPHPAHVPEAIRSAVAAHLPAPGSA